MAFQLDNVYVLVTDLDRSLEWYAKFGIEAKDRYGAWQNIVNTVEVFRSKLIDKFRAVRPSGDTEITRKEALATAWVKNPSTDARYGKPGSPPTRATPAELQDDWFD